MAKYEITKFISLPTNTDLNLNTETDRVSRYVIDGNVTMTTDVTVSFTGTPTEGAKVELLFLGGTTLGGNTLEVLGTDISSYSDETILFTGYYINSAWRIAQTNLNTFSEVADDSITTAKIQDSAVSTAKVAASAISPSRLGSTYEVIELDIDITADSVSNRVIIPYKAVLEYVRFYVIESTDAAANDVNFAINNNGGAMSTTYPVKFATAGSPKVAGDFGTLVTTPTPGTDVVGSTTSHYVEITLSQTSNQGGKVKFFLILNRAD